MLDLKVNLKKKYEYNLNCRFCDVELEHFGHIFICPAGFHALKSIRSTKLEVLGNVSDIHILSSVGKFLFYEIFYSKRGNTIT